MIRTEAVTEIPLGFSSFHVRAGQAQRPRRGGGGDEAERAGPAAKEELIQLMLRQG